MTLASYYKDHVVPSGGARTGGANKNNRREAAEPIDPDVQQKYVKWLYQVSYLSVTPPKTLSTWTIVILLLTQTTFFTVRLGVQQMPADIQPVLPG